MQDLVAFSWTDWDWHPSTVIGVAVLAALYGWLAGPGRRGRAAPTRGQIVCYTTSLLVMLGALNGPIHDLSDNYLFTAHMVQHLLLVLIVAPLFLLGTPGWYVEVVTRPAPVDAAARLLTRPIVAFVVSNAVLGLWHFPGPYEFTMEHHGVHIVMH